MTIAPSEPSINLYRAYREYKETTIDWLQNIPMHWDIKPLKSGFTFEKGKNAAKYTIEYIADHNGEYPVYSGQTENNGIMGFIDSFDYDIAEILFTTTVGAKVMTPLLLRGKFNLSQNCLLMIPKNCDIDPRYFYYQLFPLFCREKTLVPSHMQPSLRISDLNKYLVAFPNAVEQGKIADFLDRETARIDAMIEKKKRLITLLEEKRTALISHAVTKGLNPTAPMKDSGIPTIGHFPAHWRAERCKSVYREVDQRSVTGDEELLTVSHITGVTPRSEKNVGMFMAESLVGYKKCQVNDLLINTMWAWMGALGVSNYEGVLSPSYNIYRLRHDQALPEFLNLYFRSPQFKVEINRYSKGIWSSRLRLYPGEFLNMRVLVPPKSDQQAIVDYVKASTSQYGVFIDKLTQSISYLKEYRSAIVSAAVTGKIDVRRGRG